MNGNEYVTVSAASAIAGVPERTLWQWIASGKVPVVTDERGELVRLRSVEQLAETGRRAEPATHGAAETVGGGETPAWHDHLVLISGAITTLAGKLDQLYGELVASKDEQLAAKNELIAELRRRAEQAEQGQAVVEYDATARQAVSPAQSTAAPSGVEAKLSADVQALRARVEAMEVARETDLRESGARSAVVGVPATAEAAGRKKHARAMERWREHRPAQPPRRAFLAVTLAVIALIVILVTVGLVLVLTHRAASGAPGRAYAPSAPSFVPLAGVPLTVRQVLADKVGLVAPRAAIELAGGQIAVLGAGRYRVALLSASGRLLHGIGGARLHNPSAMAASARGLFIYDAARGAIDWYATTGRFMRTISHAPALRGGIGLAIGPDGTLYMANPRLNSIVELSAGGAVRRRIVGALTTGRVRFDKPSDVAVDGGGRVYVLDGADNRIVLLEPSGRPDGWWPTLPVGAPGSVHLLPLPDGRLLLSTASGGVLLYSGDTNLPVFQRALRLPGGQRPVGPLGLSRTSRGDVLVADTRGNRLLVVPLSH